MSVWMGKTARAFSVVMKNVNQVHGGEDEFT